MGLLKVQRLTEAEALANLTPYQDDDENNTSYLFLDVDDRYTLKGIFYDSLEPTEKVVVPISTERGMANDYFSYERTLSLAEIQALHGSPITITASDLGLTAGQYALVIQSYNQCSIDTDGTPFSTAMGNVITIKDSDNIPLWIANETVIEVSKNAICSVSTANTQIVKNGSPQDLTISNGAAITDGGATASMTIYFRYRKVSV